MKGDNLVMSENITFAVICWLCSLFFVATALWAFKRKDPMHFWSGTTVSPDEISDVYSYNRANGFMWAIYAGCMIITGVVTLFSPHIGSILMRILIIGGIPVLIVVYKLIYKKYRNKTEVLKTDSQLNKSKHKIIYYVLFSAIVIIPLGILFYISEQEPEIKIYDDHLQIKSIYGLDIDFTEIADISLIEKSMRELGIGRKTNGYNSFGGTLKGNFKSDDLGETLLFVHAKSSPTIKIERSGKKDIYISFRDSGYTKQVYDDLIKNIKEINN